MKRVLSLLLAAVLCLGLVPSYAAASAEPPVTDVTETDGTETDVTESALIDVFDAPVTDGAVYTGSCGTNVRWSLDTASGVLTVSGSGDMDGWWPDSGAPWHSYWAYIRQVVIGYGVTSIGDFAFDGCRLLSDVTIANSVEYIGSSVFSDCRSLTTVTLPAGTTAVSIWAFNGCANLTAVRIDADNPSYTSRDGVMYNKAVTILDYYPAGRTGRYVIPSGVTAIGYGAFSGCNGLTGVVIPDTVTTIYDGAFSGCSGLTAVTIPGGVTDIGEAAFSWCGSLESVTVGEGVPYLADEMFCGCQNLKSVALPASLTYVGAAAFAVCGSLGDVYYAGTGAQWSAVVIDAENEPLTSATVHFNASMPAVSPFDDVPATVSYYKYVMWAYENGIVKGTSATTFSPNADCTRGQFAIMLYRLAGRPDVGGVENPFTDVRPGDACYRAVLWAYSAGIIKGTSATTFSPGGSVTRGQIVTMLYRVTGNDSPFTDVKPSDACYRPVLWAVEAGVTKGTSATTFSPNRPCRRYQLVTFLYRFNEIMRYI